MSVGGWRYVTASVVGTSHSKLGGSCQDANDCHVYQIPGGGNVLVGVVSDGAGSARFGGEGAARACATFSDLVSDHLRGGNSTEQICLEMSKHWVDIIKARLTKEAESVSQASREFACTLLGAVVGDSCAAFMQVGDGGIVVADSDEMVYGHVFWPDKGEYENATYFVTQDDVSDHLRFEFVQREIVEIGLFTDGLQRLALDYRLQIAHEPFFRGLFSPIRKIPEGRSEETSKALTEFLSSPRVNEKTDDDKTLILASRWAPTLLAAIPE